MKKISIPKKVSVKLINYNYFNILLLSLNRLHKRIVLPLDIKLELDIDNRFIILYNQQDNKLLAFFNSLNKSILGLTDGFSLSLSLSGIGYKASVSNNNLILSLGFSHDVIINIPLDISVTCTSPTSILLKGNSHYNLSLFANKIVGKKPAYKDIYKKKGVTLT
jgi:ribosomal protein L6P/L9E